MEKQPVLQTKGIYKNFYGVKALVDVNFELYSDEIVSLIGTNGAGKSTLCNIIAGVYPHDGGDILIDGKSVKIASTSAAENLGVGIVYQEPSLVPRLSIMENIFLAKEHLHHGVMLDFKRMEKESREVLSLLGYGNMDIHQKALSLTLVEKEIVCIAKALLMHPKILILDEVTAALNHNEVNHLFNVVRDLKQHGIGIIFISHKIKETLQISDRVVVLRDGKNAADLKVDIHLEEKDIISPMLGETINDDIEAVIQDYEELESKQVLLEAKGLCKKRYFQGIDFQINRGEIVGFAGLKGAGITELFSSIQGIMYFDSGILKLQGKPISPKKPKDGLDKGIGMVTNDRQKEGLALFLNVRDNIIITSLEEFAGRLWFLKNSKIASVVNEYVKMLNIKTPNQSQLVQNLSGGNQQKVVIAKWLLRNTEILIVDEPTRGVDVKAKSEIYKLLLQQKAQGKGIMIYSPEVRELLNICDRIIIIVDGHVVQEIPRNGSRFNEPYILDVIHSTKIVE